MKTHVLILGAGFAGRLELATRHSESLAGQVRVTLVEQSDSFGGGAVSRFEANFLGGPSPTRATGQRLARARRGEGVVGLCSPRALVWAVIEMNTTP